MAKIGEIKISIADLEPVKSLVDSLVANIDSLPPAVYEALQKLIDEDNQEPA